MIIPDVSFYQYRWNGNKIEKAIDFAAMRSRVPGVIIRAGQNTWIDKAFDVSWKAAKAAGLWRGSYYFYDSRVSPKVQARIFADLLLSDPPEEMAWFDAEEKYLGTYTGWQHWYDFLENFKTFAPHIKLGIYTGFYYWKERVSQKAALDYFAQYPLWIAAYSTIKPQIPAPWKEARIWQYTDNGAGAEYGVASGNIDLNHYYGDMPDIIQKPTLTAFYKGAAAEYQERKEE